MKKSYLCAICKKSFLDPANLVKHVEFIHEPELSPIKSSVGSIAKKEKDPINNGPVAPPVLANQLTLSQPGGADYAHHITTGTPGFSDLPTALNNENNSAQGQPIGPRERA
jgi:hypothetical protein